MIYIPFLNGTGELYEITFADQDKDFHALGRVIPYFYELHLEKFKFSSELLATGVSNIDETATFSSYSIDLKMGEGTGNFTPGEIVYQSSANTQANAAAVAVVQSWTVVGDIPLENNTLSVTNITGEFVEGSSIKIVGATSNAQYYLTSYDPLKDNVRDDSYDNYIIEQNANSVVNFSETNPFGQI